MNRIFQYKVRDIRGNPATGVMEAENQFLVIHQLRQKGYFITGIEEKTAVVPIREQLAGWRRITYRELTVFSRQFATMLNAGVTVVKSLGVLTQQTPEKRLREAIQGVLREVESGSSLSGALARRGDIFPGLYVSMIKAGETGGILGVVMDRLADYYEKEHELREKIKAAARYPVAVSIFAAGVVIFLVAAVLPTFVQVFAGMNAVLPLPTRILLSLSDLIRTHFFYMVILLGCGVFAVNRFFHTPQGRVYYHLASLKLPVVGEMVRKISIARVCRTMGTLLNSGVPFLQALEVAEDVADNTLIKRGLTKARESIREGEGIARPLEATGVFPAMVTAMIAVGEETGNLDTMLNKISDYYDREVRNIAEGMTGLLEPLLIIFLALVIGGIMISIIWPVFDMYRLISRF
ncbi:MAG: type II secretion system F family protein [Clostridia bacterium]|nr:type II secretion system F family protein [Clostridia bacterium]